MYATATPVCVLALTGAKASLVAGPAPTLKVALAPVSPVADTCTVAVPELVTVKLEVATPLTAATGDGGLKVPGNAVNEKVMGLVALVTVLP